MELHLSAHDHDKALQQGIGFAQDLTLSEDMDKVRLIVFDRGSNAIGSVTMPVPEAGHGAISGSSESRIGLKITGYRTDFLRHLRAPTPNKARGSAIQMPL